MIDLIDFGLLGLFLGSFLAATILPFSSEALLALMLNSNNSVNSILAVATLGNWLGGMSCYYLGYLGNWMTIEKYLKIKPEKIYRIKGWVDKRGSFLALLCWVPFVGDPLAVGLGVMRVNALLVSIYMLIGKFIRYVVVIYLVYLGKSLF